MTKFIARSFLKVRDIIICTNHKPCFAYTNFARCIWLLPCADVLLRTLFIKSIGFIDEQGEMLTASQFTKLWKASRIALCRAFFEVGGRLGADLERNIIDSITIAHRLLLQQWSPKFIIEKKFWIITFFTAKIETRTLAIGFRRRTAAYWGDECCGTAICHTFALTTTNRTECRIDRVAIATIVGVGTGWEITTSMHHQRKRVKQNDESGEQHWAQQLLEDEEVL